MALTEHEQDERDRRAGMVASVEYDMLQLRRAYSASVGSRAIKVETRTLADDTKSYRVACRFSTQCVVEAMASLEYVIGEQLAHHLAELRGDREAADLWLRGLERKLLLLLAAEVSVNGFLGRERMEHQIMAAAGIAA